MKLPNLKMSSYLVLIITVCSLLLISGVVSAQDIPPAFQGRVTEELQKRGLTEGEVRARLIKEGIDLQNVPPDQLINYKSRVIDVLDKMQAEKKNGFSAQPTTSQQSGVQPVNVNIGGNTPVKADSVTAVNAPEVAVAPVTTSQEAAADAAQRVIQATMSQSKGDKAIYGHSLFAQKSLEIFRTTDGAQAPDTYVLSDGDEIRISIFGASQTDIQQKIALDGSIQPTGSAKIFLKGLTIAQAREVIPERLSSAYSFRPDQFALTIVTARTILVNVFGESKITGGFTISALNSALNALSAAGGPTEIGSVRNIQLIRGTSRKNIDLYAFMNDPSAQFRFDLQNNDIIFVPVVKSLVSIEGAVKRPMIYEMLPNESLTDLIHFAGDVNMDVFPDFVQIQRFVNGEQRLIEYKLDDVRSGKTKVELINGDIVHIKAINKPMDQFVEIDGSVYYPGKYDLASNANLSSLLRNAKFTVQAKTDLLFVERIRPDNTVEQLSVKWLDLQKSGQDFILVPRDRVRVAELASFRDVDTITVVGQVRSPFKKGFSIKDRITVKQAIEMADGLKTSVYPVAYIFRRNLFNPLEMQYIRIELSKADNIELQPGDQLNIYDNTTYTNVGEVRVFGAVKNPNKFTYDPSLTLRDVLTNAGGFEVGAAFNRVEIFRTTLSTTEKVKLDLITVTVDSSYQVVSPKNFALQPYDQIVIRMTPEFRMARTVQITGEVEYPGTYVLETKRTQLSEIIKMSGGLLDNADPFGSSFFRTYRNRGNISINLNATMNHAGNLHSDPILFEGDVININRRENTVTIRETGTRMAQYSINPESINKNVIYRGSRSAAWYVRNYAGGFQRRVDHNSVTVTLPNDQMLSTRHVLFFFHKYPSVKAGSIISMQMKPHKEKPVDGNNDKLDATLSRTTQGLTAVLTLYLLINQLSK